MVPKFKISHKNVDVSQALSEGNKYEAFEKKFLIDNEEP